MVLTVRTGVGRLGLKWWYTIPWVWVLDYMKERKCVAEVSLHAFAVCSCLLMSREQSLWIPADLTSPH